MKTPQHRGSPWLCLFCGLPGEGASRLRLEPSPSTCACEKACARQGAGQSTNSVVPLSVEPGMHHVLPRVWAPRFQVSRDLGCSVNLSTPHVLPEAWPPGCVVHGFQTVGKTRSTQLRAVPAERQAGRPGRDVWLRLHVLAPRSLKGFGCRVSAQQTISRLSHRGELPPRLI